MLRLKTNLSPTNCDGFFSIVGQERFENKKELPKLTRYWILVKIFAKIPIKNGRLGTAAIIKVEFNVKACFKTSYLKTPVSNGNKF